ncbi:hypothetical protein AMTR_s00010p00155210 [Amborella trichopoda]|uniref:Uncharacterized protein n=1 Tax=Amborella trichopoda TaxID=13333 RepID=W1NG43_AMBTC|nr:hypothetical protein AMTR_s00010p00155210 [Amborella trichopoda]
MLPPYMTTELGSYNNNSEGGLVIPWNSVVAWRMPSPPLVVPSFNPTVDPAVHFAVQARDHERHLACMGGGGLTKRLSIY